MTTARVSAKHLGALVLGHDAITKLTKSMGLENADPQEKFNKKFQENELASLVILKTLDSMMTIMSNMIDALDPEERKIALAAFEEHKNRKGEPL